jgi:hypothetical protein
VGIAPFSARRRQCRAKFVRYPCGIRPAQRQRRERLGRLALHGQQRRHRVSCAGTDTHPGLRRHRRRQFRRHRRAERQHRDPRRQPAKSDRQSRGDTRHRLGFWRLGDVRLVDLHAAARHFDRVYGAGLRTFQSRHIGPARHHRRGECSGQLFRYRVRRHADMAPTLPTSTYWAIILHRPSSPRTMVTGALRLSIPLAILPSATSDYWPTTCIRTSAAVTSIANPMTSKRTA